MYQLKVPKAFWDALSEKTKKEISEVAARTRVEYESHHAGIAHYINRPGDTGYYDYNNITKSYKYRADGFQFCPVVDLLSDEWRISRSLQEKANKYDALQNSLSNIKGAIDSISKG